jgi:hypothetical protein
MNTYQVIALVTQEIALPADFLGLPGTWKISTGSGFSFGVEGRTVDIGGAAGPDNLQTFGDYALFFDNKLDEPLAMTYFGFAAERTHDGGQTVYSFQAPLSTISIIAPQPIPLPASALLLVPSLAVLFASRRGARATVMSPTRCQASMRAAVVSSTITTPKSRIIT